MEAISLKAEAVYALVYGLKEVGIDLVASLPSSGSAAAVEAIRNDRAFTHVAVANEHDAIGICYGAWLGGKKPALIVESAGLILGSYALLSTTHSFGGFPALMIVDYRGDFGDGLIHGYFGYGIQIPKLLESFQLHYCIVREASRLVAEIVRANRTAQTYGKPVAILLSGEEMYAK